VLDARLGDRWGLADAAEAIGGARRDLLLWCLVERVWGELVCVFLQATSSPWERGVVEEEDAESGWVGSLMKGGKRRWGQIYLR